MTIWGVRVYSALVSVILFSLSAQVHAQFSENRVNLATSSTGLNKATLTAGTNYFITVDNLNVRSSNSISANNIVGKLALNDEVQLVAAPNGSTPLAQVIVVKSSKFKYQIEPELYVSADYLSDKKIEFKSSKYFVIQNIATEKTRVYERCTETPDCPHKMVMETDMVVGRPEDGTEEDPHGFKTWLGHAKISEWIKFYQDTKRHYPFWYKEGQSLNTIPGPISRGMSKIVASKKWVAEDREGNTTVYGAFGWYAAKLTPADETNGINYQWMHGTIGWGRDGATAIELTRSFLMNLFRNQGSAGCTRLENRAIAYLRHLLPVGTDIYRVYARESTREQYPLSRYITNSYTKTYWDYILLTDGAQKSGGLTADARTIYNEGIRFAQYVNIIEIGTYEVDNYPTVVPVDYSYRASSGQSGDRYQIDNSRIKDTVRSNFKGYFLIDEGRFVDYEHPNKYNRKNPIRVGGLPDFRNSVPDFLKAYGNHYPPR